MPRPPVSPVSGKRQNTTQVYGIDELYDFEALLHDISEACRVQRIPVQSAVSEYAPGQYEINLQHVSDALESCDDALLFKRVVKGVAQRSEEHTSELQSLMRISYAVFCLKKKKKHT